MKDTHKHSFEEEFRKAFEEAEATPEPTVWAEIDAHLANQEAAGYKRKLYYFKIRVAAAAILLFGFLGGWLAIYEHPFSRQNIVEVNNPASSNQVPNGKLQSNSEKPSGVPAPIEENTLASAEKSVAAEKESSNQTITGNNKVSPAAKNNATNTKGSSVKENTSTPLAALPENNAYPGKQKSTGDKSVTANTTSPQENKQQENDLLLNGKGKTPFSSQYSIARNSANTISGVADKPATEQTAKDAPVLPQKDILAFGTTQSINRLNNKVYINNLPLIMEAPTIQPQINNSFLAVVEEEEKQTSSASKWAMNVAFTPNQFSPNMQVDQNAVNSPYTNYNYANRSSFASPNNLSPGLANANNSPVGNDLENAQASGISYNIGVNVSYALSDRFSVQSGVQYMRNNSQIVTANYVEDFTNRDRYPAFLSLVSNNSGEAFALADSPVIQNTNFYSIAKTNAYSGVTEVAVYNTYQYLSIPLRLHYKLIDRKISTSVGAGIAADVFLNNTIGNEAANISDTNLDSHASIYKSIGMSGIFSTKLDYEISSRYSVFLEPSYRTAITSFTKSYMVKSLPSAFGIGTGFQYRF